MKQKNDAIRKVIYDELKKAYPQWLTCSEIAHRLSHPTFRYLSKNIYYYVEDMFFSQGHPPFLLRIHQDGKPNKYRAIKP